MLTDAEYKSFGTSSKSTGEEFTNLNVAPAVALKIALPLIVPVSQ